MIKWDKRFLELASLVSSWSKDPSTQTGAVIVRSDKTVASMGFNGFPRQIEDTPELLNNREEKYKRVIHCELNAIINAREQLDGYTLYNWPGQSCSRCAVHVIQAGITRVVSYWDENSSFIKRWREDMELAQSLYIEAGVKVVYLTPREIGK
jgi:dCMP deaminase